jgi:hypothetical protein
MSDLAQQRQVAFVWPVPALLIAHRPFDVGAAANRPVAQILQISSFSESIFSQAADVPLPVLVYDETVIANRSWVVGRTRYRAAFTNVRAIHLTCMVTHIRSQKEV